MIFKKSSFKLTALALATVALAACGSAPKTLSNNQKDTLDAEVRGALAEFRNTDPGLDRLMANSFAYAVFPEITAGAVVVGGAHGTGEVFRGGRVVGRADVSKANIGTQIGGQSYSQLVFFENERTFADFTNGTLEFDAKASAVAASKGASSTANYERGVLVFTQAKGGLMLQAAIGGQKFRFRALGDERTQGEIARDRHDSNPDVHRDIDRDPRPLTNDRP